MKEVEEALNVRGIYEGLETIDDKIEFLIDYDAYLRTQDDVDMNIQLEKQQLENDFINQYIIQGTHEDHVKVFETLGKHTIKNVKDSQDEKQKYMNYLTDKEREDPKLASKKAMYCTQFDRSGNYGFAIQNLTIGVIDSFRNEKKPLNTTREAYGITRNTPIMDFLSIAPPKDPLEEVMAKRGISPDQTVNDFFLVEDKNPKTVMFNAMTFLTEGLTKKWTNQGREKYYSENNISPEQQKTLTEIALKNKGDTSVSGIEKWIASKEKIPFGGDNRVANADVRKEFELKYIKKDPLTLAGFNRYRELNAKEHMVTGILDEIKNADKNVYNGSNEYDEAWRSIESVRNITGGVAGFLRNETADKATLNRTREMQKYTAEAEEKINKYLARKAKNKKLDDKAKKRVAVMKKALKAVKEMAEEADKTVTHFAAKNMDEDGKHLEQQLAKEENQPQDITAIRSAIKGTEKLKNVLAKKGDLSEQDIKDVRYGVAALTIYSRSLYGKSGELTEKQFDEQVEKLAKDEAFVKSTESMLDKKQLSEFCLDLSKGAVNVMEKFYEAKSAIFNTTQKPQTREVKKQAEHQNKKGMAKS